MEDNNPKRILPKNFQEEVVDAIVKSDLAAFKKSHVGKNDINRRLLPNKELKPVPKYNKDQHYINIKGPTMLMFAILCEQDEIVEYILDSKNPNVLIYVEGYSCLHLAAMVKDPKCLKLLLQHKLIQENVDQPVYFVNSNASENLILEKDDQPVYISDKKTTALHLAVSNRLYDNVILLLKSYPKPRWPSKRVKTPKDKETVEENDDDDSFGCWFCASVNQKSDSELTPLYIAVSLCDYKMVKILLSFEADPSIECANGKTPLALAYEMRDLRNERSKPENDEIDLIVTALQNAEF